MRRAIVAGVATTVVLAACSSGPNRLQPSTGQGIAGGSGNAVSGTITVFAASSLTEAFTTLGRRFEAAHRGAKVSFDFDASSSLAEQIMQGAPADVFASASPTNMAQVRDANLAARPTTFARNVMEIAVPPANPAHVSSVADLAKPGVKVATCDPSVPCGSVAQQVFRNAKLDVHPATLQPDVKSTLQQVELGEVDAAMVYVTDVRAAGSTVRGVAIPPAINASTDYPIAALAKGPDPTGGNAFVSYVLSAQGRKVLAADGFHRP